MRPLRNNRKVMSQMTILFLHIQEINTTSDLPDTVLWPHMQTIAKLKGHFMGC